jgi:AraC-like DNA-binding protein
MTSRRVEYLFRDLMGFHMRCYQRCRRLHLARMSLISGEMSAGAIKQVAPELGRFAGAMSQVVR